MIGPLNRAALAALAFILAATALPADAGEAARGAANERVSVVVTGRVNWVEPPQRLGLDGGWTVELPDSALWIEQASELLAAGEAPLLKVAGTRIAGDEQRLIRAGGVVVLSDNSSSSRVMEAGFRRSGQRSASDRRQLDTRVGANDPLVMFDGEFDARGYILSFNVDGFRLDAEGSIYDVVITEQTEFDGFSDLSELEVGYEMEVRGELQGSTIIATRVKLRSDGEDTTLRGLVLALGTDSFQLDVDGSTFDIVVTADTELDGFGDVSELTIGQEVEARGTLVGTVLTATRVKLLDGGSGGVDFEYEGLLTALLPPDRFVMDDGRSYTVDQNTMFDPLIGTYEGLVAGQFLEVEAMRGSSGSNLAVEIKLEGDEQGGQGYREIEGVIMTISPTEIVLESGAVVTVTPGTIFVGDADSPQDVLPGWWAEIYALLDLAGVFNALEVRTDDREAATTEDQDFEPQQALLVPAPGADPDEIAARFGAQVVGRVGSLGALLWFPDPLSDDLLAALNADPEVAAVEPNYLFQDPESVRRRYATIDRHPSTEKLVEQLAGAQINLDQAHQLATGEGMVVAVIDTGVDPLHPVLRRRLLDGGLDLVDGDLSPWEERDNADGDEDGDVDEAAGHGTFVASLVVITAPGASILPYRVLDDEGRGTAYDLAVALADAIESRVDVINLSLVYRERSSAVDLLLERAAAQGIVVIASAGNDGSTSVPFPASDSNTLAVAALDQSGLVLAAFSNRSHLVGFAAPGEEVFGALDELAFGTWSGTSMAAPFVAGTAALLLSADPGLDPVLVRNAIEQGGVVLEDAGWTGRVLDALAAVSLVKEAP